MVEARKIVWKKVYDLMPIDEDDKEEEEKEVGQVELDTTEDFDGQVNLVDTFNNLVQLSEGKIETITIDDELDTNPIKEMTEIAQQTISQV